MYIAVSLYIALDHDAAFSHAGSDEEFDDESVTGVVMEHYETLVSQLDYISIYYSYMYDVWMWRRPLVRSIYTHVCRYSRSRGGGKFPSNAWV